MVHSAHYPLWRPDCYITCCLAMGELGDTPGATPVRGDHEATRELLLVLSLVALHVAKRVAIA